MHSRHLAITALLICSATAAHAETIVYPNTPTGETYSNASGTNQGQAIGATGWFYNNVRNGGSVGIDGSQPRSGTGSVHFVGQDGGDKADIEYLATGTGLSGNFFAAGSLGAFSDLFEFSYDWYRSSASTNPTNQHPSLRVLLDRDGDLTTTGDRGGLVFEAVYNGTPTAPTNQWVTSTVSSTTKLWNFGLGLGSEYNLNGNGAYGSDLSQWKTFMPNARVLGFSSGIGSGWNGYFEGWVDNIEWTFGETTTRTNFEVQAVPEPTTLGLLGLALAAARRTLRRGRRA